MFWHHLLPDPCSSEDALFCRTADQCNLRASAVEPHSGGVTNFMTDPSLETWIGLAAFIDAFILSTLGFNEDKDKRDYFLNI